MQLPEFLSEVLTLSGAEAGRREPGDQSSPEAAAGRNSETHRFWIDLGAGQTKASGQLMGASDARYAPEHDAIVAGHGDRKFGLAIRRTFSPRDWTNIDCRYTVVVTPTRAEVCRSYSAECRTLWAGELSEFLEILRQDRSLSTFLWPKYFGILSHTVAVTFSNRNPKGLFRSHSSNANGAEAERTALKSLNNFATNIGKLVAFPDLATGRKVAKQTARSDDGSVVQRRYDPGRSSIIAFNERLARTTRDDFISSYIEGGTEYGRDFAVLDETQPSSVMAGALHQVQYDLLYMLAIRRLKLFRNAFARRVYNLVLPPLSIELHYEQGGRFVVVPCVNLYRPPLGAFRPTISVSLAFFPVEIDELGESARARAASLEELNYLRKQFLKSGAARAHASSGDVSVDPAHAKIYRSVATQNSVANLVARLMETLAALAQQGSEVGPKPAMTDDLRSAVSTALAESRVTTANILVDWDPIDGRSQLWQDWVAGKRSAGIEIAAYRALFLDDFLDPASAYAAWDTVDVKAFSVGNTLGADITGVTLFNPNELFKVCLYPQISENYPNHSILRWAAWQIYTDSALASLRALIQRHSKIMDGVIDLHDIIGALGGMVKEFAEFYDLDIREYFYRKEYEKLRSQMQVDQDFAELNRRLSSSKEDELLREQRLINKLILALTLATVSVSVISTAAQMGALEVSAYVVWSLGSAAVLVLAGYIAFDPIKRAWSRLARKG